MQAAVLPEGGREPRVRRTGRGPLQPGAEALAWDTLPPSPSPATRSCRTSESLTSEIARPGRRQSASAGPPAADSPWRQRRRSIPRDMMH